jgi:hypothetical protein
MLFDDFVEIIHGLGMISSISKLIEWFFKEFISDFFSIFIFRVVDITN